MQQAPARPRRHYDTGRLTMRERRRYAWFNVALLACLAAGVAGAYFLLTDAGAAPAAAARTVTAQKGVVMSSVSATGNLAAPETLSVGFETGGTLTKVAVAAGAKVKRGQILATLDAGDAENQVQSAEANVASAQAHFQQLLDGMTDAEKAQNAVAVRQANVALANAKSSLTIARKSSKQSEATSTLTLSQALAQQRIDQAQLSADTKSLVAAKEDLAAKQAIYDAAAAQAATDKAQLTADQAAQQQTQQVQADHTGTAQIHQKQQSAHQTTLSNAKSTLQSAQQAQTAACSPDPTVQACLDATAATAASTSAVSSAQSQVDVDVTTSLTDQETANADSKAVSAAAYTVSQSQSYSSDSQSTAQTAKTDLQTAQNKVDSLETAITSDTTKVHTDGVQVVTARNGVQSTKIQNAQNKQNAVVSVRNAELSKKSTLAGNAVKAQPAAGGDLASARASVATAEVALATAKKTLAETTLRAPASGTVATVGATVGQTVSGGGTTPSSSSSGSSTGGSSSSSTPLFTLVDIDGLRLTAGFSESDAAKIKLGQPATITVAALPDKKLAAHVAAIDTLSTVTSNVVTYNVTFVLDRKNAALKAGMSADVDVITAEADGAVSVPTSAIRTAGGASTVTVRKNGQDTSRTVVTGLAGDSSTVILSGIKAGDVVVLPTTTVTATSPSANSGFPGGGGGFGGPAVFGGGGR